MWIELFALAICLHCHADSNQPTVTSDATLNAGQTNSIKAGAGNESVQKMPEHAATPSSPPSPPRAELGEPPRLPR